MSAPAEDPREGGASGERPEPLVVRDRRRIDPLTGQLRAPAAGTGDGGAVGSAAPSAPGSGTEPGTEPGADTLAELRAQVEERTADLQRLQAEYANYRRRVDRDRDLVREQAVTAVLGELVPVLDDVGRAREHGELVGGFRSVAEALEAVTAKAGLQRFGEPGEPFDPTVHEALTHSYADDVDEPTSVAVLQPGYRVGGRVLRPARVAVAEPAPQDPTGAPVHTEGDEATEDAAAAEAEVPAEAAGEAPL